MDQKTTSVRHQKARDARLRRASEHSRERLLTLKSECPLGARVTADKTLFRLFAPRAHKVIVFFFKHLDSPEPQSLKLYRRDQGIWEAVHHGNLHGWYYYYQVHGSNNDPSCHFDPSFNILDPYALATAGPEGPGIIWELQRITGQRVPFHPPPWHDLVILEAHVRDLIREAPILLDEEERRGFSGLRKWVEAKGSYLKNLGVNAVELQPIQEFGDHYPKEAYHWGYMSVNFFSPESSYALVPELGSQIAEFKELVAAFHRQNIAVILDVVYNHAGEPNHLIHIDKYYYFNVDEHGNLTNWSGCGNDFRANTPMGRRLIIDSLIHFAETYDVDGFRFDLAELLGLETLREIEAALKQVKPSVILIAEPWSFRGHIALDLKTTGFAFWNDGYREFIRDYLMGQGNQEGLRYFIGGSLAHLTAWPAQTVNYVESHDDHCWIDKITENPNHYGEFPTPNDRRRTHLMVAIMMCSLGIPMLAAGQDTLRTKRGVHNSYRDGELNAVNYHRLVVYSGTHDYFSYWIRFRCSEHGRLLRLDSPPSADFLRFFGAEHGSALAVLFNADRSKGHHQLLFAVNPHHEMVHISLHDVDLNHWTQLADHERFDERGLKRAALRFSQSRLELLPLTCGLWMK
jgi:pullulanase